MTGRRYTVISADTHAGGSHEQYREYLDPEWREEFDAWRGQYKNPWKDLRDTDLRVRNWDDDRRDADQLRDGVVGEVVFPNTVPPFYPAFVLFARPPKNQDEYVHRRAGIKAHNRWLADFCARRPERRAGIGQIFLNDIDDAIEDLHFIKEHGLRGGILLPNVAPDIDWVQPIYHPDYDRLWAVIQDLDIVVNVHGGTGNPNYGKHPFASMIMVTETMFYSTRPFSQLILSGVFERFPRLKMAVTETAVRDFPQTIAYMDDVVQRVNSGAIGELKYTADQGLKRLPSEYVRDNVWFGASFPLRTDIEARHLLGADKIMWGNDYPHDEGTGPYSRETLRQVAHDVPEAEMRMLLGENAAKLYGFDLAALQPIADEWGPTIEELQVPLTELPAEPNEALLKEARRQTAVA